MDIPLFAITARAGRKALFQARACGSLEKYMTTLKEIAARYGCSVATVSKALNGMPDIGAETAQKIRDIANEMGYIPNAAARTLKTNRSHTIGLMMFLRGESVWLHDHFSRIAAGIQEEIEAAGFDLTPVTCTGETLEGHYLEHCRHRGYDGLIVMSGTFQESGLQALVDSTIPLVTIDYAFPHHSAIFMDHAQGIGDLVKHVYGMGHRRIAYVYGQEGTVAHARLRGFLDVCSRLGVEVPPEYIIPSTYRDTEDSARATRVLMALPKPPTCILYPDDYACTGGMNALMDMGLRIPEDVSVAGYDGIPLAQLLRPRLTTILQDGQAAGRMAGSELLRTIRNPHGFAPRHIVLPCSLIPGASVGKPRE